MNEELYNRLVEVAKTKGTITYSEVAQMVGLDISSPDDRREISRLLCEISKYENKSNRPLLSAVVVRQANGMPGWGFFNLAIELNLYAGNDNATYFENELKKVHDYWSNQHSRLG